LSRGFFITGTDTDVGKTTVALALMAALQRQGYTVAGFKPVSAGCERTADGLRNDDAVRLMQQASVQLPYDLVNPYAFEEPIAPHIAAERNGVTMQITPLMSTYREIAQQVDIVIVEGAGGWLVPLNERETMADVAVALDLPVILVVGLRLGCLNHALLTQESIQSHGLPQAGWIANHLSLALPYSQKNLATLSRRLVCPLLATIPYLEHFEIETVLTRFNIRTILDL
jgi:dethiobiotin synthetase